MTKAFSAQYIANALADRSLYATSTAVQFPETAWNALITYLMDKGSAEAIPTAHGTTASNTDEIHSRISVQRSDSYDAWELPARIGYSVVKLEIIPYKTDVPMPPPSSWRMSTHRATFVCQRPSSGINLSALCLMNDIMASVLNDKDVKKTNKD